MFKRSVILSAAILLSFAGVSAQSASNSQGVKVGAFKLYPSIGIYQQRNDNIFAQANQAQTSSITQFKPSMEFRGQVDDNVYTIAYKGDYGRYDTSSDDDFDDHALTFDFNFGNSRNRFDVDASYAKLHENRGDETSEGAAAYLLLDPQEYDLKKFGGSWDFGSEGTTMGFMLSTNRSDIDYDTPALGLLQDRSRDETGYSAKLYGRVAPKTRFFLEYATMDIEYSFGIALPVSLDSKEEVTSFGAEWDISGKTKGSVKIGETNKEFDAAILDDSDTSTWEIEVSWSPLTYSTLTLSSSKSPKETNGTGLFIAAKVHTINWKHEWTDSLSHTVSYSTGADSFIRSAREDDRDDRSIRLDYVYRHKFNIGVGYYRVERDSNANVFDFDREVVFMDLNVHF